MNPREMDRVLGQMQAEVRSVNAQNGWFETDRSFGEDIALLHSEVSEMLEAHRDGEHETWFEHKVGCIHTPLNVLHDKIGAEREGCTCVPKPHGVGPEAGDVLVRLLDTCERRGINLGLSFRQVLDHNRTRGKAL